MLIGYPVDQSQVDLGGLAGVLEDRASGRSHQQKVLIHPRSAT